MEPSDRIQYYEILPSTPWYYYLKPKSNFRVEIMKLHFKLFCIESIMRNIKTSSIYQNDIDWFIQKLWKLSTDRWVGHNDEKTWTRVGIWPNKGKLKNKSNQVNIQNGPYKKQVDSFLGNRIDGKGAFR